MPEATEGQPTTEASAPVAPVSSSTPVAQAPQGFDPSAFKAEIDALLNQRISGIQAGYQAQINERDEQIRQLKTSQMSEDEREQLAEQEAAEYLERLETQAGMLEISQKFPKATPVIQKLFEAQTLAEQAQILDALLNPQPVEPQAPVVPPVDPNNPPRQQIADPTAFVDPQTGQIFSAEERKRFLQSLGSNPAADFLGRG